MPAYYKQGNHLRPHNSPPGSSFVVVLLFVVRCEEGHGGQVFILRSDASHDAEAVDLTVDPRAAALLDGDLDVSVILWETRHLGYIYNHFLTHVPNF